MGIFDFNSGNKPAKPTTQTFDIGISVRNAKGEGLERAIGTIYPYFVSDGIIHSLTNFGGRVGFHIQYYPISHIGWAGRLLISCPGYKSYESAIAIIPNTSEDVTLELEAVAVPFPTRQQACTIRTHFQGLWVTSKAFSSKYQSAFGGNGQIPYYGADYVDFAAAGDGDEILDQLKAAGDTHVMLYVRTGGKGYNQNGQPYGDDQIIPAFQSWDNFDEFLKITDRVIEREMLPLFVVYAEGDGLQEVKNNWSELITRLGDRIRRGPILLAWDSLWPGSWSVSDMKEMIPWLRERLGPLGYLAMMFAGGSKESAYLWVEDSNDYTKPWMDGLDIVCQTDGTPEVEGVSLANKAGYMLRHPNYRDFRPDQGTHFIFHDCSRGERYYLVLEWNTYGTVRDPNQTLKPEIDAARERMQIMGYVGWG